MRENSGVAQSVQRLGYRLDRGIVVPFPEGPRDFLLSKLSRETVRPNQFVIQRVPSRRLRLVTTSSALLISNILLILVLKMNTPLCFNS
jgi:hypothetical protein